MLGVLLRRTKTTCSILSKMFTKSGSGQDVSRRNLSQLVTPGKEAELVKDIVLYRHEAPRLHLLVSIFAFGQFTFWTVLGCNMLSMKDLPVDTGDDTPYWKRINWGENSTKKIMAAGCFLIGNLTLLTSWFFIARSIRYLVLRKNKEVVSVVTFTPAGRNRFIEVPLKEISCWGSRADPGYIPIKIKGRFFMFVLDSKKGVFTNSKLFDQTVGIHRKF